MVDFVSTSYPSNERNGKRQDSPKSESLRAASLQLPLLDKGRRIKHKQ
jgi:hypothetical protein